MKRLDIFLLCATVSLYKPHEVCGGDCVAETLSEVDASFCHGGLEVIYPDLKISPCSIIPRGQSLRDKMTGEWGPPQVRLTNAEEGSDLKKGDLKGLVLSEYRRPTPPRSTGLHRYQFMLFEQPADKTLSLSQEESSSLGNWDPQAFIQRFGLGRPLASVQFLTQNPKD
ncbi:phosphatidylethanolamine-binding protein 4 isoform X2 [Anguilla rostrata]|uniref:phosphatidylethanolamine-binding protein 4 isoform X2 n=1 Tax=Anguilla anguilla TaxID=7936 RepID=UPI0015B094A8|nr:phosphatidylethanolamine-binding protein 4 isoform X2 [Anguilla anguilla]